MTSEIDPLQRELNVSGFCVVPNVIPPAECLGIRNSVLHAVNRQRENYPNAPQNVGFTPSIINHDQSFASYLAHQPLMELLQHVLGHNLRISFTSAIINEPGNQRGDWHADWPFNQRNAGHVPAPYPDAVMHITTLWMLSPFSSQNGGTLVLPGSHRSATNPTCSTSSDSQRRFPSELNVTGAAGSVLVMDSRLWHATAPNDATDARVALAVRYAPWWLNLNVLGPESDERKRMCDEVNQTDNIVPPIDPDVFSQLPHQVQQLYRHWIATETG